MENIRTKGVFFNEADIKGIVEKYLDWTELCEDQVFCAETIMNDTTPIGTSIIVGVDGIRCEDGSDVIKLVLSSGIYEIPVRTVGPNDEINVRFDETIHVQGTYGVIYEDGTLDILTDEEKEFKWAVDEQLGERDDEFAQAFRADNTRAIGGRGLVLLEKIKTEIKNDNILTSDGITPSQLVAVFIELTDKYINACANVESLTAKHDEVLAQYKDTYEEGSKATRKLAREVEVLNQKIDTNYQISEFCLATINAAVYPVLRTEVAR